MIYQVIDCCLGTESKVGRSILGVMTLFLGEGVTKQHRTSHIGKDILIGQIPKKQE